MIQAIDEKKVALHTNGKPQAKEAAPEPLGAWAAALLLTVDTRRYPAGTQMESVLRLTAQFMAARDRTAGSPPPGYVED